ncbi:unnamed protein product [Acanthoscelides obtectus]|uniref:Uncharacterized protein n=1 Tax=Acanthoscelides obtectus TaxID=200917 RepID=A0A9P0MAE2_ACAOB|nr:unnamed protein product [Acanthoscelides obtectus]CAK1630011.1 hypothetical protein AOBTE_LOCUS6099 [Acanthoscelides obtectus]
MYILFYRITHAQRIEIMETREFYFSTVATVVLTESCYCESKTKTT